MGKEPKYALLDTDFLYKSHLARDSKNHTLADFVMEFEGYEFFCHEMIKEELSRHELIPDPNPWLEDKIRTGKVKLYTDWEIVSELGRLYGKEATNAYLELLKTSCDTFNAGFYEQYYDSLNELKNLEDVEVFLAALKTCDDNVPHKKGLGEKKTYVLIQMMEIMYGNRVYVFCSDDFKARQSIAGLETPVHCISILGVFYKLMRSGKEKSEMKEYYDRLAAFLKTQVEYKVWSISGHQREGVPVQQVFNEIYDGKFRMLGNGDLQYIK